MSIEEAWKAIDSSLWWSLRAMDNEQIEAVVDERLAVKASLLAVLEEAIAHEGLTTNHEVEQVNDRLWCCSYHMLSAHIERLGR